MLDPVFFFNDSAPTEIYTYGHTLSLHDALPIWARGVERGQRQAGLFDGHDGRVRREVDAEPARVVHLRDQAAVGDTRRDAVAEFTGGRVVLQQRLERGEAFGHPVPRPDLALGLGHAPVARQVLHYAQVVERVHGAGDQRSQ